ncbi:MAG: flagellar biosynthetic protein FliQ [Candidatus Eremiobacteraeota bacterium]|nr:flagellar biosynthetic protein FliQ [Candidatus Eremiobacteraeota bacterium]
MNVAIELLQQSFAATLVLVLPMLALVGGAGVLVGVLQTLFQVQDQNVAFIPKVVLLAGLLWVAGPMALASLVLLLQTAARAFPAVIAS